MSIGDKMKIIANNYKANETFKFLRQGLDLTQEELAKNIKRSSLCGLGQTAPNPVLSTLKYFRDEYEAHINEKRCPAGECKAMTVVTIDKEKCRGCSICAKNCPVNAIHGELKSPFEINPDKCIKCGVCIAKCPFHAISRK